MEYTERKLLYTKSRALWMIPLPILLTGLLYGGLRFSGRLFYITDAWDPSGVWNYTNQNHGAYILFLCGCALLGAILAIHKENTVLKTKRQS